jgi:hypothetical protein
MQRRNHERIVTLQAAKKPSRWAAINTYSLQQESRSRSAIADKALDFGRFSVLLCRRKQNWRQ